MNRIVEGVVVGALGGLGAGVIGELLALTIRRLFPTDVGIIGFAVIWAVPMGALVGAIVAWRGWLPRRSHLAAVAAVPGVVAGVLAALLQWSVV